MWLIIGLNYQGEGFDKNLNLKVPIEYALLLNMINFTKLPKQNDFWERRHPLSAVGIYHFPVAETITSPHVMAEEVTQKQHK